MKKVDVAIDSQDIYDALNKVLGDSGEGSTVFDVMRSVNEEHGDCEPERCPYARLERHLGHFTCDMVSLLQAYMHAALISVQGIQSCQEETVNNTFGIIQDRMECITESVQHAMRSYSKWCLDVAKMKSQAVVYEADDSRRDSGEVGEGNSSAGNE